VAFRAGDSEGAREGAFFDGASHGSSIGEKGKKGNTEGDSGRAKAFNFE
jgi:hypothetical protein